MKISGRFSKNWASNKGQAVIEYMLLVMIVVAIVITFGGIYQSRIQGLSQTADLNEATRRSFANGHFESFGWKELEQGNQDTDYETRWLHPVATPNVGAHSLLFKRHGSHEDF